MEAEVRVHGSSQIKISIVGFDIFILFSHVHLMNVY